MGEQDARASLAFDISYGAVEEPAGEEDSLRGTDGGGADVAVQDRLLLILRRDSDNKESDNKAGDCRDADVCGLDQAQHQLMDWVGLCAYEQMVFAGAVAVGSRADVVDRRIVACGDMSADGGEIRLFTEDV